MFLQAFSVAKESQPKPPQPCSIACLQGLYSEHSWKQSKVIATV